MFAVTGATGNVGGAAADALLKAGAAVRVVVRDAGRAGHWQDRGCEVAVAHMEDAAALTAAFRGAEGVFILPPPEFDPAPGYPEARRVIDAVIAALVAARPNRIVCLSTVGADAAEDNLLSQRGLMEGAIRTLDLPITILRPAWFLDNIAWDVAGATDEGVVRSFLAPIDRAIPMVAARDVGRQAATLLRDEWTGTRIVGLEGPAPVSPVDIADAFSNALGRPVRVETVPRESWEALFREQGMRHPEPRMRMLDGFNEGWIRFEDIPMRRGETSLSAVIARLIA
jgi:NAD(P)H dehydrogenase (quinone)